MLSDKRVEKEAGCEHKKFLKKLLTLNSKVDNMIKSSKTTQLFLKKNFKSVKLTIEITIKTI
ncbi:TPA: hypothetical protein OHR39_002771 [Staphylococcus aureus]|uniref:hypothetical protein n=1 Tax=Staphylococcus aureus TaxID=1280 RepID=UPI0005C4E801|nr:hypothetical protein [Staphylococcus aureus]HCQ2291623.1 hypothetical protein [Staphylococcus aureus]HCQ2294826.1 hypothetical protein [Staphylococcus aureus]HCQ2413236.1 hypothetical protein [Staphylococcus aureus]HCQ3257227.1 hypothetical protein [Staphylococcus aureus]HCQ3268928.1 hypothetical protein [Staphylococcus aureus]